MSRTAQAARQQCSASGAYRLLSINGRIALKTGKPGVAILIVFMRLLIDEYFAVLRQVRSDEPMLLSCKIPRPLSIGASIHLIRKWNMYNLYFLLRESDCQLYRQ